MINENISLKEAADSLYSTSEAGVYILYLNGQVMKVGKAEIGIQKRMQQYYGLNSYCGLNLYINEYNRDSIRVTYQTCSAFDCDELESKLFDKYSSLSSLPWASRRPHSTADNCQLLI
ncbi:MAG: hypothetical protein IJF19_02560 [Clostridia bacterium]|nr:hypothetical protein [Clostridia bacterium]